jgi:hypothetical protein
MYYRNGWDEPALGLSNHDLFRVCVAMVQDDKDYEEWPKWDYLKGFVAALGFGDSEFVLVSRLRFESLLWALVRPEWDESTARAFWLKAALTKRRFWRHPNLIKLIDQLSPTAVLALLKYLNAVPYPEHDYKWLTKLMPLFSGDEPTLRSRLNKRRDYRRRFPTAELEFNSRFLAVFDTAVQNPFGDGDVDVRPSDIGVQLAISSVAIPAGWFLGARGAIVDTLLTAEC